MRKVIFLLVILPLSAMANLKVGDTPPSFLGKNRLGQEIQLADMKGKVVVATFWASWCPPCLKEMNVLEKMQRQVGKDKLEIVAINFKEDKKRYNKIKKKLSHLKLTLTHDRRGSISRKYGVKSIPHMFIINKLGLIEHIHLGYNESSLTQLVDELNELLASS